MSASATLVYREVVAPPGVDPATIVSSAYFEYGRFAREVAAAAGVPVGVRDAGAAPEVPSGILLVDRPWTLDDIVAAAATEDRERIVRSAVILRVPRDELDALLRVQPVAAAISSDRYLAWLQDRSRPYPETILVRRDLTDEADLPNADGDARRLPMHGPVDASGRANLAELVGLVVQRLNRTEAAGGDPR